MPEQHTAPIRRTAESRRRARRVQLPYPDLPPTASNAPATQPRYAFSLAAYQRDVAELDALEHFQRRRDFTGHSTPFRYAIYGAEQITRNSAEKWLERVVSEGGLLLAGLPDQVGA